MLVTGANGVGKTNLLEALHVGSQGFSPRTRVDTQLVRFGTEMARVTLGGNEQEAPVEAEVVIRSREPKRVWLNGAPLTSAEELRARLSALVFVPDRLAVVKGGPIVRRAYFDRMLGRIFPALASLPAEYGRVLAQRNEALRRIRAGVSTRDAAEPWTRSVAGLGTELETARGELIGLLAPRFAGRADALGLDRAELRYDVRPISEEALAARFDQDLARGVTGLGPHLRDIEVGAGERDLRNYGSQGEQRTAVLGLVLAEGDVVADRRGLPPLLLLDDVLSELDRARRVALLASLPPTGQSVITAATHEALPAEAAAPQLVVAVTPGRATRA